MMKKYSEQEKELLKSLTQKKIDLKDKGTADLEAQIETLKKEVDTLKTIIDLKDLEINKLKENDMNDFLSDLAKDVSGNESINKFIMSSCTFWSTSFSFNAFNTLVTKEGVVLFSKSCKVTVSFIDKMFPKVSSSCNSFLLLSLADSLSNISTT